MERGSLAAVTLFAAVLLAGCSGSGEEPPSAVKIWEEPLTLPTYEVGEPDPNPRFYTGRAYQGAQGRAYPYPMQDQLTDHRAKKTWKAVYLENEYVKLCILPEIGGRLFSALDKTNGYDFFYRQQVIKPALIGMLGAWISGGIEWNFPHHHRASAFLPMDYELRANPDGSKTVWLGEVELRHRMRWVVGVTLRPGRSFFEATIRPFNRTPFAHSFLYWSNASVHAASGEYQVIFPPGTEYATYHSKNAFAHWPVSHEEYRGVDYTKGVDLSWWKNHPSPMSFFCWNYEDDFLAGYDHGEDAGVAHISNHHIAPGKKLWEWGPGPRGQLWDKLLTDTDGPYVELMTGGYSDNQPDYSWLQPYEGKTFGQWWYPLRGMGGVKNANLEGAVDLTVAKGNKARVAFNTTARHEGAKVLLRAGDRVLLEREIDIGPGEPFEAKVDLPAGVREEDLRASLVSPESEELIAYQPVEPEGAPMPEPVSPPLPPAQIESVEELYLAGMRLTQFYNPSLDPRPYYEEALKRDPGNCRVHVALALLSSARGLFEDAEDHLRVALARVAKDYTSPRDGEAYYYLGLVSRALGKDQAAYDALYKATWSHAFHSAAYFELASMDCVKGEFAKALLHLDRSIATNAWNPKALDLRAAVLRRLGRDGEAAKAAAKALALDPLDLWAAHETHLLKPGPGTMESLLARQKLGRRPWQEAQPFLETAIDYANCGMWEEAGQILSQLTDAGGGEASTYPMVYYWLGHAREKVDDAREAARYYRLGSGMDPRCCFPFRLESIDVLLGAARNNPGDARAHYYLGNLLYELQPERAIREWEKSRALDDGFATVHRNLGMAYARREGEVSKAIASLERAVSCDGQDPRLYYELDLLREAGGVSPEKRLELLRENHETIVKHNDAFSREVVLLTQLGHYDQAIEYLRTHHFRRWEGVGNIHTTFVDAHLLRALRWSKAGQCREALKDCEAALEYPEELEAARPYRGGRSAQVHCITGMVHEAGGETEKAAESYRKSAAAKLTGKWSRLTYYQGVSLARLGEKDRANEMFAGLVKFAKESIRTRRVGAGIGFFTKFGTRRSPAELMADAHYLLALGLLGSGDRAGAKEEFGRVLSLNVNHLWAAAHLAELKER